MTRTIPALLSIFAILGCQATAPTVDNFNAAGWKSSDSNCTFRIDQAQILIEQREQLIGHSQEEIRELLGTPDRHEIYKRSEKFIVYYIEPGLRCADGEPDSLRSYLSIRFTSVGPAKEILIHKY